MITTGMGRVAEDVTLQKSPNGVEYVSVGFAHTIGFGEKKSTEWYRCVAYGDMAQRMANAKIKKGSAIFVTGTQSIETYKGKDNVERTSVKLNVLDWSFVSTGKSKSESTSEEVVASADDELPLEWE